MNSRSSRKTVSIVTPSYNQGQFIEGCIRSIRNQDYPYIEHIIIDGGSTDETLSIIHRYKDGFAYWVSERDRGISDAINKGFARSTGDYMWILNSDDMLVTPGAISALVRYLADHPDVDFVCGDQYDMDKYGKVRRLVRQSEWDVFDLLLRRPTMSFTGCLITRQAMNSIGFFSENLQYLNDFDLFLRFALRYKMANIGQPTGYFRVYPEQTSRRRTEASAKEKLLITEQFFQSPDLPVAVRQCERKARAMAYLVAAGLYCENGNSKETRHCVAQAIQLDPLCLVRKWTVAYWLLSLMGDLQMVHTRTVLRRYLLGRIA